MKKNVRIKLDGYVIDMKVDELAEVVYLLGRIPLDPYQETKMQGLTPFQFIVATSAIPFLLGVVIGALVTML